MAHRQQVREVMTADPVTIPPDTSLAEAAKLMRDRNIGDVFVGDRDHLTGLVTDRDIVVRGIAEGTDPGRKKVGDVCSSEDLVTVSPEDDLDRPIQLMREHALRRIAVVDHGSPVGVVSIGDLAKAVDPGSALADISAARPNR